MSEQNSVVPYDLEFCFTLNCFRPKYICFIASLLNFHIDCPHEQTYDEGLLKWAAQFQIL